MGIFAVRERLRCEEYISIKELWIFFNYINEICSSHIIHTYIIAFIHMHIIDGSSIFLPIPAPNCTYFRPLPFFLLIWTFLLTIFPTHLMIFSCHVFIIFHSFKWFSRPFFVHIVSVYLHFFSFRLNDYLFFHAIFQPF